jgi:probable F420-dependent oxidoreductase
LLPSRDVAEAGRPPAELIQLAVDAEAAGYDSVWLGESVVARSRYEPLTVLAAVAMRTHRVALGTAVLVAPLRHPVSLAHTVASLDQLSGGRVILGLGAGPSYGASRKEYATLGVPFEGRFRRLSETIEICRRLWGTEPVTYEGQFYRMRNVDICPKPAQSAGPPIWLGAKGPTGRRLAAGSCDGWMPGATSPTWLAEHIAEMRREAGCTGRGGSRPTYAVYLTLTISDDLGQARHDQQVSMERYYRQPSLVVAGLHDTFAGPAQEAASWLRSYVTAGAEHLVLRLMGDGPGRQLAELAPHLDEIRRSGDPLHRS